MVEISNPEHWMYLGRDDVAYIVDALIDASTKRRERGGAINIKIADNCDDLALRLYDWQPTLLMPQYGRPPERSGSL